MNRRGVHRPNSVTVLHLTEGTPNRRQLFTPATLPSPLHTHPSLATTSLVLLWLQWEAWSLMSTWPRLDSDHLPQLPHPPSSTREGTVETLTQYPISALAPLQYIIDPAGDSASLGLTFSSWTPEEEISRQDCRENCQCEQRQLRKKVEGDG